MKFIPEKRDIVFTITELPPIGTRATFSGLREVPIAYELISALGVSEITTDLDRVEYFRTHYYDPELNQSRIYPLIRAKKNDWQTSMKAKKHVQFLHTLDCAASFLIEGKRVKCEVVHHPQFIRDDLSDWLGIPLLKKYHSRDSPTGLHYLSRRGFERMFKVSELDLLAVTIMFIQEKNNEAGKL